MSYLVMLCRPVGLIQEVILSLELTYRDTIYRPDELIPRTY